MKLLDKLKNTFFEEEYVEVDEKPKAVAKKVEVKEKKRDIIKKKEEPKVEEIKEEVKVEEEIDDDLDDFDNDTINYSDSELTKQDTNLPYFDDDDFVTSETVIEPIEEPKKVYGESIDKLYSSIYSIDDNTNDTLNKPYQASVNGAFKPTPIISPIYGILDKNYKKEEVVDKKVTDSYVSRQSVDLDSIRNKAYPQIDEEKEEIKEEANIIEDDFEEEEKVEDEALYDMTSEDSTKPVVDKVTIADAEEYFEDLGLEYNIDYKDSRYEKATGRRASSKAKQEIEEESVEEDANLEDNLFDIIDSIYDEEDKEVEE